MSQNVVLYEVYAEAEEKVELQGHNRRECVTPEHKTHGSMRNMAT